MPVKSNNEDWILAIRVFIKDTLGASWQVTKNKNKTNISPIFKKSIFFVIPFLITSCGGGITLKATDGSKIKFKKENVSCTTGEYYKSFEMKTLDTTGPEVRDIKCTANGVTTYLNGFELPFSEKKLCKIETKKGKKPFKKFKSLTHPDSFACAAGKKFKRWK